jgi:hypothetical protein
LSSHFTVLSQAGEDKLEKLAEYWTMLSASYSQFKETIQLLPHIMNSLNTVSQNIGLVSSSLFQSFLNRSSPSSSSFSQSL